MVTLMDFLSLVSCRPSGYINIHFYFQVHSANDWEHAKLGDEERKQKFLRLMGGKKVWFIWSIYHLLKFILLNSLL